MKKFQIISQPKQIFNEMLKDIKSAKKEILLETYIYQGDNIGRLFRNALIEKAKKGVKIKVLIDAWGARLKSGFFDELVECGAEVRFFREIRYLIRIFSKNHERSHRKLLVIDNEISYIGSANITGSYMESRELVLKMTGSVANSFRRSFFKLWDMYGDKITEKRLQTIIHEEFEIINDVPSDYWKITESKYSYLIKNAKKSISIETPYFVPSIKIRKSLASAVRRGVKVQIIVPYASNWIPIDIVRNRYLGDLYKKGIEIYYYKPGLLHSKLMIIDNSFFLLGSSNLDYRSLIYLFEVNCIGKNKNIIENLKEHFKETFSKSIPFNYHEWKKRSSFKKLLEILIFRIRHYL